MSEVKDYFSNYLQQPSTTVNNVSNVSLDDNDSTFSERNIFPQDFIFISTTNNHLAVLIFTGICSAVGKMACYCRDYPRKTSRVKKFINCFLLPNEHLLNFH